MPDFMQQAAGIGASVPVDVFPPPLRETRNPTTADKALPGQVWFNRITNVIWVNNGRDSSGYLWSAFASNVSSIVGTANQITATNVANVVTLTTPATFIAPGSIASTTTITAGTNLATTNGNLTLGTAGNKIIIATGSNASVGTSAAMSGTPGAVTVATTASSASAKIFYSRATTGGTPGQVSITAQDGTGFTLTSTGNETSTFNWWIINA